ncbi:conserved Plasmodium protein, unknown function [Plasmodium knowlesi strain H]|uniref:Uncharacterized protein n=3 Tax=Plasmodium knowlesi TaxID=5850 RepID=A0A5K1UTW7_PLAKH|nr:conserved Plasmodium protein, unknown function [Plasmodium knowlesi strain H]OTN66269.1 Uncharacterized protein PKNOH_S09513000 [Plasmodium knowlesi]CAA9986303.1 conserved Plasmodium protein, unknown function [Plasmodium knowlesi strain H]SBO25533.1 conserved Plasmodium protein, unknown function [Plasmodium knowlesi strain H]SBO28287.1 conserved Plasmodium protein, unknown function [Plasmodium knowlesi strain H]VVS75777.1 conserved Plasmodium protein, unknown function [Plasmodium knowlesi s|eukprot:XP_002257709.1 hypothetical protein, conserved in Plasmodium species [Plasmodium knowlesi strain H]
MKLFQRGFLPLLFFCACLFLLFRRTYGVTYDLANLGSGEKRLALNLLKVFEEARGAERGFYERLDNTQKIFDEVGARRASIGGDRISGDHVDSDSTALGDEAPPPLERPPSSFVQVKSKGPVEEETIWRALYDTQLRRSPPNEQVHVYSLENVQKEFAQAKADAFLSQIAILKKEFELSLCYMREELMRGKKVREVVSEAVDLEDRVRQGGMARGRYENGVLRGGAAGRGVNGTKVLC